MNLVEFSADFDAKRRLENRNAWRRYHYNLARVHYNLAEEHRRKMVNLGAEEVNETTDKGAA